MLQSWRRLTFLHWPYSPAVIQRLIPPPLEVDTFEGSAWIGLVPFELYDLRIKISRGIFAPVLPHVSRFAETNVRTYVRGPGGERAVWFFTLEAERLLAVGGARLLYSLPYRWARMSTGTNGSIITYRSRRLPPWRPASTDIQVEVGEPIAPGERERFLTARFALYTERRGRLALLPIEHSEWELRAGRLLHLRESLVASCGIPDPTGAPLVYYSADLQVKTGGLQWL